MANRIANVGGDAQNIKNSPFSAPVSDVGNTQKRMLARSTDTLIRYLLTTASLETFFYLINTMLMTHAGVQPGLCLMAGQKSQDSLDAKSELQPLMSWLLELNP